MLITHSLVTCGAPTVQSCTVILRHCYSAIVACIQAIQSVASSKANVACIKNKILSISTLSSHNFHGHCHKFLRPYPYALTLALVNVCRHSFAQDINTVSTLSMLQVSLALKALYDEEIVDEELIVAWHGKPSAGKVLGVPAPAAKAVRLAAAKFVEWLQEAESDEESEESEDSLAGEEE